MRRILVGVAYDGTNYSGWQIQDNADTIQQELELALFKATNEHISTFASGRTDAGVHAVCQCVHFDINNTIPVSKISVAVNDVLPKDIKIIWVKEVDEKFNARFDVKQKTYLYKINISKNLDVFKQNYEYFICDSLDIKKMKKASKILLGEHDFTAFCSAKCEIENKVRTIYSIKIEQKKENINIFITGNGFLQNMVRIIVGTLIEVGKNNRNVEDVNKILNSKKRQNAGITAPPHGLYLLKVKY